MVRESVVTLLLALIFAPIAALFSSLPVQGCICAGILMIQFFLMTVGEKYKSQTKKVSK